MLKICTDLLPQTCLSYVAFRIAFRETLERIALWKQFEKDAEGAYGYLCEVPFLREIPPHVQLDLLARTWAKHLGPNPLPADLVDESVVYAVCETTARLVEQDSVAVANFLKGGPLDVVLAIDHFLASELRGLHLNLSNEGDFLLVSQFLDMPPDDASKLKTEFNLEESRLEAMFDALGQWNMSPDFAKNLFGLVGDLELARITRILQPAKIS